MIIPQGIDVNQYILKFTNVYWLNFTQSYLLQFGHYFVEEERRSYISKSQYANNTIKGLTIWWHNAGDTNACRLKSYYEFYSNSTFSSFWLDFAKYNIDSWNGKLPVRQLAIACINGDRFHGLQIVSLDHNEFPLAPIWYNGKLIL